MKRLWTTPTLDTKKTLKVSADKFCGRMKLHKSCNHTLFGQSLYCSVDVLSSRFCDKCIVCLHKSSFKTNLWKVQETEYDHSFFLLTLHFFFTNIMIVLRMAFRSLQNIKNSARLRVSFKCWTSCNETFMKSLLRERQIAIWNCTHLRCDCLDSKWSSLLQAHEWNWKIIQIIRQLKIILHWASKLGK